jgi:hypothetical protein
MSNLYNQNIGQNYRGILNLDATTINTPLNATLRAVTDGMGTASPLQLSTDQVGISRTVALSAGATNPRLFNEVYTINNSGAQTGTLTGLFLNATETALNGMSHNLMDLQVGGVSKFRVDNFGNITSSSNVTISGQFIISSLGRIQGQSSGVLTLTDSAGTSFNRLQFGGTTNAFPSIKRNGTAIDFRLADDSNFCNVNANGITISSGNIELTQSANVISNIGAGSTGLIVKANGSSSVALDVLGSSTTSNNIQRWRNASAVTLSFIDGFGGAMFGGTTKTASAFVQIDSTTQGFLPPRQTTTQINAIASPAEGLVVFNTTISHLCVYQGGNWVRINHSPM